MPALMGFGIVLAILGAVYAVEVFLFRRRPADINSDIIYANPQPIPEPSQWKIRLQRFLLFAVALVLLALPISAVIAVFMGKADGRAVIAAVFVSVAGFLGGMFGM